VQIIPKTCFVLQQYVSLQRQNIVEQIKKKNGEKLPSPWGRKYFPVGAQILVVIWSRSKWSKSKTNCQNPPL
jgi:hypothetical protein